MMPFGSVVLVCMKRVVSCPTRDLDMDHRLGAANLLATDQLRSFPSLLREALLICDRKMQKRVSLKEGSTQTMDNSERNGSSSVVPAQRRTSSRLESASNKARRTLVGKTVSHYRILGKLGIGGVGGLYPAQDVRLGRHVAVKFASDEFETNPAVSECFRREAHAGSALNHPNVCAVYDVGDFAGRPFIVMELLEGRTLRQLMQTPFGVEAFLNMG